MTLRPAVVSLTDTVGTALAWLAVGVLGAWLLPVGPWPVAAGIAVAAAVALAAVMTKPLFAFGARRGERDHLASAMLATALCAGAAWTLPPLSSVPRWRIQTLANISWLAHQLRWERLRVRAGAAEIRRARRISAGRPDQAYLLAHALTMEACRFAIARRFDIARPLAREAEEVFATFDGLNDPDHAYAARHIAAHVRDWERGILVTH